MNEREVQLKQIRESRGFGSLPWSHLSSPTQQREVAEGTIDFLLSLIDSQAAPIVHRNYECMTTVADETLWCPTCAAHAEYLRGYATAAIRMRDACVEKVRQMGLRCGLCPHSNPPNADGSCSAYGYNGVDCQAQPCVCRHHDPTVQYHGKLITALESLTLDGKKEQ